MHEDPKVPVDIVELIMDWLVVGPEDARKSHLAMCSLVCHFWHDLALKRNFRTMRHCVAPSRQEQAQPICCTCKTFPGLVKFLEQHSTLAKQVQELDVGIVKHCHVENNWRRPIEAHTPPQSYSTFVLLLHVLPHLKTLQLRNVEMDLSSLPASVFQVSVSRFRHLDQLSVFWCPHAPSVVGTCALLHALNTCVEVSHFQVVAPASGWDRPSQVFMPTAELFVLVSEGPVVIKIIGNVRRLTLLRPSHS